MTDYIEANRRYWDEATGVHVRSDFYDVESFKRGGLRLKPIEQRELGDVTGKSLLHLQCHFGLDTLSWARLGATVTGLDFSVRAVEEARALAAEVGIDARFVQSDIYDAPAALPDERFDIVFTSYGVLGWLPDIPRWGQVVAGFVKPGGMFYIAEFHPAGWMFDDKASDWKLGFDYFPGPEPVLDDDDEDYADRTATMEHTETYFWNYPLGDVISALIGGGLRIEHVHEFPYSTYQQLDVLERREDGFWHPPAGSPSVPLLFSIKAVKD